MNAYEKRVRADLEGLLGAHIVDYDDANDQLLTELLTYVTKATRRSYINGLNARDAQPRGTRPVPKRGSALQNGKLRPVSKRQQEGA